MPKYMEAVSLNKVAAQQMQTNSINEGDVRRSVSTKGHGDNLLQSISNAVQATAPMINNNLKAKIAADQALQTQRYWQNKLPTDDATRSGAKAWEAVSMRNDMEKMSGQLLVDSKSREWTDKEWADHVAESQGNFTLKWSPAGDVARAKLANSLFADKSAKITAARFNDKQGQDLYNKKETLKDTFQTYSVNSSNGAELASQLNRSEAEAKATGITTEEWQKSRNEFLIGALQDGDKNAIDAVQELGLQDNVQVAKALETGQRKYEQHNYMDIASKKAPLEDAYRNGEISWEQFMGGAKSIQTGYGADVWSEQELRMVRQQAQRAAKKRQKAAAKAAKGNGEGGERPIDYVTQNFRNTANPTGQELPSKPFSDYTKKDQRKITDLTRQILSESVDRDMPNASPEEKAEETTRRYIDELNKGEMVDSRMQHRAEGLADYDYSQQDTNGMTTVATNKALSMYDTAQKMNDVTKERHFNTKELAMFANMDTLVDGGEDSKTALMTAQKAVANPKRMTEKSRASLKALTDDAVTDELDNQTDRGWFSSDIELNEYDSEALKAQINEQVNLRVRAGALPSTSMVESITKSVMSTKVITNEGTIINRSDKQVIQDTGYADPREGLDETKALLVGMADDSDIDSDNYQLQSDEHGRYFLTDGVNRLTTPQFPSDLKRSLDAKQYKEFKERGRKNRKLTKAAQDYLTDPVFDDPSVMSF